MMHRIYFIVSLIVGLSASPFSLAYPPDETAPSLKSSEKSEEIQAPSSQNQDAKRYPASDAQSVIIDTQKETQFIANVIQLITEGKRSGEGYFSADGSKLVFQSEQPGDNPFYQIYLSDLNTGETKRISTGIGKTSCAWIHPNGRSVLFASTHQDDDALGKQQAELDARNSPQRRGYSWSFDEFYDIYTTNIDGSGLTQLTRSPGYDAEGSWSPDGQWIAFASNRLGYQDNISQQEQQMLAKDASYFMDIYLMRADGSGLKRLTQTPGYDGGPFFSPDGQRITWRRFTPDGRQAEVWTMNLNGDDQKQLTRLGALSWAPYYHPSGDYIIFATSVQGHRNFELYLVDVNGTKEPVRITYSAGFDGLPVFSPDGRQLAWSSARTQDSSSQIFLADWNDKQARLALGL